MAYSRVSGGVVADDSKTSYQMNPSVGHTLGGGFHVTTFECIAQIFREGLRPGGGGDRINTFFVPFAPWDRRCSTILRYKRIEGADLVYIYLTYESLAKFAPRVSADGQIMAQQTIPFDSFDAVWSYDKKDQEYYRLMTAKGYEQMVLSVKNANEIATIDRFDNLVENITLDESSPDWKEIRQLVSIKDSHKNYSPRIYPGLDKWNEAISLLAMVHRPNKEGHRLCPACLFETPAVLSICTICSHGVKKRTKVKVASSVEPERRHQDDDVKDHVKQAWEKVKIDLTNDGDDDEEPAPEEEAVQMEETPGDVADPAEGEEEEPAEEDDIRDEEEGSREPDQDEEMPDERDEGAPLGEINIRKFKVGERRDAAHYPAWMARINFGSKILPLSPCLIGDAQPELIKVFLLQMGVNLFQMSKQFHRNFCGRIETAWQYFQSNKQIRMDLDPKVPYLGEDENGVLIEPSDEKMREFYHQVGNPKSKDDLGEGGFVNAYHGAQIFKKLIIYILECGYSFKDLQEIYGGEQYDQLKKDDTHEEETMKTLRARDALEAQSDFMR